MKLNMLALGNDPHQCVRASQTLLSLAVFAAFGATQTITESAGLVEFRSKESISQLVERADRALCEAKAKVRNRVASA